MDILFTDRKLPSIHSESVPRSRSKASTYSYEKNQSTVSTVIDHHCMLEQLNIFKDVDNKQRIYRNVPIQEAANTLLWRRMSDSAIFLFSFEKYIWRQPYCFLGSGLVCSNSVRPWACLSYVNVLY